MKDCLWRTSVRTPSSRTRLVKRLSILSKLPSHSRSVTWIGPIGLAPTAGLHFLADDPPDDPTELHLTQPAEDLLGCHGTGTTVGANAGETANV
jgi:hypothetical protein